MNRIVSIFAFIIPLMVFSQETKIDKDTLLTENDNQYIQNHNNQLNIKFEVSNELITYNIPFEENMLLFLVELREFRKHTTDWELDRYFEII